MDPAGALVIKERALKKPQKLQPGDTLAIVSPSWGGPSRFPQIHENGVRVLEQRLGLKVRDYPTARMDAKRLYENPKIRAEDINRAFGDPKIKGIVSSIGGNDSIRVLEHLDLDLILNNPKLIMGYSDSTAFLAFLNLKGLGTFYGPCTMAGFSYLENFPEAIEEYKEFLFGDSRIFINPFPSWADKYRDWGKEENVGMVEKIHLENIGHHWINKGPPSKGKLWGGCAEVLEMMKGTFAWPLQDFWQNRILFLETSEDKPTPEQVGYMLRNYGIQGALSRVSGLIIGRPKAYSEEEKEDLEREILKIVVGEFGCRDLNIVTNLDMGHTDPRHIFPLGIEITLDSESEAICLTEEAFD